MSDELLERLEARLTSPKLTPMMRQYLTVKSEYPEALVLFRMGDFFETFFEDAEDFAQRLDITLTARSKERDVPMAGVPHHALDAYLGRLVEQGCTVVIVDQVEDPKRAKGLVRREITRIVTPGTYIDPNAPPRKANYLVALELAARKKSSERWALGALDVATGDFRATSGDSDTLLVDELARLGAREVVVVERQVGDAALGRLRAQLPDLLVSRVDDADYGPDRALAELEGVLGAEELRALSAITSKATLVAAARALTYASRTQVRGEAPDLRGPASLGHIHGLRPYQPGQALILDREARDHLELFRSSSGEAKGSLLHAIDRAVTPMGGRLLAEWLAYPPHDLDEVRSRHAAVSVLAAAPGTLDLIREGLAGVSDVERLVGRVVLGRALPRDLLQLGESLRQGPRLLQMATECGSGANEKILLDEARPTRLQGYGTVDFCEDVLRELDRALHESPSNDLSSGIVFRPGFDEELDRQTELATQGKQLIENLEHQEKETTKISSLKVRYNKVFGYYIEVTKPNLSMVPEHYVRKQTTVNAERFFTAELKDLEDEVLHAEERRRARTETLFAELVKRVGASANRLQRLAQALADLDVLTGLAHLAETRDWVRPEMVEGSELDLSEARHPVLEPLAGELGERFVANDLRLSHDERLMIITGPNMSGKSTIMRQTALAVILAYMGSFVPARAARIGRVDRVFTRVGASDELARGRSTFMVEMNETARILRSATAHDLVVLDEIGRGTSTFDGLSIAWAVAEYLHDVVKARVLFATHYHEMTALCEEKGGVINRHVAVREHGNDIVFLRKLQPGSTNRSYGVQVARLAGLPASVVKRARAVLDVLEAQALSAGTQARALRQTHQLHLFDGTASPSPKPPPEYESVLERLRAVDVDDLSPRQALSLVAELQSMLTPPRG